MLGLMKNYYTKLPGAEGVKVKATRRGIRIDVPRKSFKLVRDFKGNYRRTENFWSQLRKFKIRHLKLGPYHLFKLLILNLNINVRKYQNRIPSSNFESGWMNRSLNFTVALTVHNQSYFEINRAVQSILNQKLTGSINLL